jgi:hypothetical protein
MEKGAPATLTGGGKAAQQAESPGGAPGTRRSKRVVDILFGTHSVRFAAFLPQRGRGQHVDRALVQSGSRKM